RTTLKLRVESSPPLVAGFDQNLPPIYDPAFLHRQCVVLRSPVVLAEVVRDMKLAQVGGMTEEAAVNVLARQITVRPAREQDLLMLEIETNDPGQTLATGDALVAAYEQQFSENARRPARQLMENLR